MVAPMIFCCLNAKPNLLNYNKLRSAKCYFVWRQSLFGFFYHVGGQASQTYIDIVSLPLLSRFSAQLMVNLYANLQTQAQTVMLISFFCQHLLEFQLLYPHEITFQFIDYICWNQDLKSLVWVCQRSHIACGRKYSLVIPLFLFLLS